jgi:invasion protein IalB
MRFNRHVIAHHVIARQLIAAGAVALLAAPLPALAQDAPAAPAAAAAPAEPAPAESAPAAATPAQPQVPEAVKAWAKFCDKQQDGHTICIVRKLSFHDTSIIGSFVLRIDQAKGVPILAVAAVPVGVVLKPGLRWQVDRNKAQTLPYWRCTPQTCESEQLASPAFINQLRKGNTLTLTAKDVNNKDLAVQISLAGFSAAYDMKDAPTFAEYSRQLGEAATGAAGRAPAPAPAPAAAPSSGQ